MSASERSADRTDRFVRVLGPFVDELEDAADEDDLAAADVFACLAALGRGKPVPSDAAERIVERAREESR